MHKKKLFFAVLAGLSLVLNAAARSPDDTEKRFSWGLSERLRYVSWDNTVSLDASSNSGSTFTRHRTSAWLNWQPHTALTVHAKATNEFRYYITPERDFNIHEVFVDNLFLKWRNRRGVHFDLTAGRQNIMLGEGFLVMDGHPLDGSRSIYFNAVRLDMQLKKNHTLTLFGLTQPPTDDLLPVLNNLDQPLVEQEQKGLGAYYSGSWKGTGVDAYLIRKDTDIRGGSALVTAGMRLAIPLTQALSLTGEGALQRGEWGAFDQQSWGGYARADYRFTGTSPLRSVTAGGIALSGDDPATPEYEDWNPLFSRWPKWSESYIYALILEKGGRVAWWSNFTSLYGSVTFRLCRRADLIVTAHRLGAFHDQAPLAAMPMGTGTVRGNLFIVRADFSITGRLSGHLLYETFSPGSFYSDTADSYNWFRCELFYTFQSR